MQMPKYQMCIKMYNFQQILITCYWLMIQKFYYSCNDK